MSNEADLDWLARNVHVWKGCDWSVLTRIYDCGLWLTKESCKDACLTKAQWLARRSELQNKPSWADAPEWAEWLAQHGTGFWCWGNGEAKQASNDIWYSVLGKTKWIGMAGEVLGGWRDTLERRSADLSESAVTERLTEATQAVLAAAPALMDEKFRFDREDWFERGELPPVGEVCLYVVSDRLSAEVEITAHAKLGLCFVRVGQSGESYVSKTAELHRFRPIRTERDVLIEMLADMDGSPASAGKVADAILAAGFKRGAA